MERHSITMPRIAIPKHTPASAEEIARRRSLAEEVDKLAEEIGTLDYDVADLIREGREDDDQSKG